MKLVMKSRPSIAILGILLASWAPFALAAQQRFSESTSVVVVEVPVQVVRDGKPVRGLTAADFEVYEGRQKQEITGFEVLDLAAVPAAAPAGGRSEAVRRLPMSARRRFVLLFDLGYSKPTSLLKARETAKRLLDGGFHPTDLIAVAAYLPSQGPQLLLGFTPNRQQVREAVDRLSPAQNHFASDPLLLAGSVDAGDGAAPQPQSQVAASADTEATTGYTGREATVSSRAAVERSEREKQRSTLAAFTRAVGVFADAMAAVDGRKNVILLSEGFDSALALGTTDEAENLEMSTNSIRGDVWNIDNDQRFGNTKASGDLEKMLEALRRADCVVQAVDIGGVRASADDLRAARSAGADGLFLMANSTGGELYQNFNDLGTAMEKMLDRTSVTYVLSFQPDVKQDGQYHKLRVELKNAKAGRVVYRPGYYAPKPFNQRTGLEKALQTAGQVVAGQEGGPVGLSVLAAPFKVPGNTLDNKAYVPVVIEIDGPSLLAGTEGKALPAEIYVYAMDEQGAVQDFFTQTAGLDLAKVGDGLRQGGIKFFGDLDLQPGNYSVRVLVRNARTGAAGLRVAALEVPVFSQAAPVLLPPLFPDTAAGHWLVLREAKVRQGEVPYPFMSGSQPYIPSSRPALRPGESSALSLVGYRLGEGELQAQAVVMTAEGKEAGEGKIEIVQREKAEAGGPDRLAATFRPPQLQPGEYLLLITLTNAQGAAETSVAPFVIPANKGAGG
ncbi:MAG TPA: VWA domain-containing protein [Thermoanaerobaculia bacterium]|jgi:VWFA-related protein|nr:VWA domain-containing protein [Thermoanaerobaculia bacterium]